MTKSGTQEYVFNIENANIVLTINLPVITTGKLLDNRLIVGFIYGSFR